MSSNVHSSPIQETWFELSFVLDSKLERVAIRSASPSALSEITAAVDRATKGYLPPQSGSIKSFSVVQIQEEAVSGSATGLLDTLTHAAGVVEGGFSSPESEALWEKIQQLAQGIDETSSQSDLDPVSVAVGFVWDNGGSEDNAFEDGFSFSSPLGADSRPLYEFLDLLKRWGEDEGVWYDFHHDTSPSPDPREGRMSLRDFKSWVDESGDDFPVFMTDLVEDLWRHELEFEMDETLESPNPAPSIRPRRI